MDEYGIDNNFTVKFVIGLVIGLLVLFLVIPLTANMIATQTVATTANNALQEIDSSDSSLPSTTSSILPTVTQNQSKPSTANDTAQNKNNDNGKDNTINSPYGMSIISGSITTGSSLSSKSVCTIFVGKEYAGTNIQISTLYSRNGKDLNAGRLVSKTVSSDGYVTLKSADSYSLYPDECLISIYDTSGVELDYKTVYLETESGTQRF